MKFNLLLLLIINSHCYFIPKLRTYKLRLSANNIGEENAKNINSIEYKLEKENSEWLARKQKAEYLAELSLAEERKAAQELALKLKSTATEVIKPSENIVKSDRVNSNLKEIASGLIVALASLPTSIAYASIVGVGPLTGIWTSIILGSMVAIVGGGVGLIAGSAGVIAQPLSKINLKYGPNYMALSVIMAGVFEMIFGKLKLAKLSRLIDHSIVVGFMNSFALFLLWSQKKSFQVMNKWLVGPELYYSIALAGSSAYFSTIKASKLKGLPGSLIGLVVTSLAANIFNLPVKTLSGLSKSNIFSGGLKTIPNFIVPKNVFNLDAFKIVFTTSLGIFLISIIETIISNNIIKENNPEKNDPDRLITGLGLGNIATAFFGGIGGCGLIPQTILNKSSGGKREISVFSYALFLSTFVIFLAPIIGRIPLASLAGIMMNVSFKTFEWKETNQIIKSTSKSIRNLIDSVSMLLTIFLCLKVDICVGVMCGSIFHNLFAFLLKLFKKV